MFTLHQLTEEQVESIVRRAMGDVDRGLGGLRVEPEPEAMRLLVNVANGDARVALNGLETAVYATAPGDGGVRRIRP